MRRMNGVALLSLLPALVACEHHPTAAPHTSTTALSGGVVARVGKDTIVLDTVERIVRLRRLSPDAALELATADSLFSEKARQDLDRSKLPEYFERLSLARSLLDQVKDESKSSPATDEEIAAMARLRWWEFDRPEMYRTTHAVIEVKNPNNDRAARALAEKVRDAVQGASDPKEFRARAEAVAATPPLAVRVEDLPFVTRDGRTSNSGTPTGPGASFFHLPFAEAAASIGTVGHQSPVVRSESGYHVILLTEIMPAKVVPIEEQRRALADDALSRRAKDRYQQVIDELRRKTPVTVSPQAEGLMASVEERP